MRWMMHDMNLWLDTIQFGNRISFNTHYLTDFVLSEVELGRYVNQLTIDYRKAFDKVDITVALEKLLSMNLRTALLNWVGDFLSIWNSTVLVRESWSNILSLDTHILWSSPRHPGWAHCFPGDGQPGCLLRPETMDVCWRHHSWGIMFSLLHAAIYTPRNHG